MKWVLFGAAELVVLFLVTLAIVWGTQRRKKP
jgi:hypothetical protein